MIYDSPCTFTLNSAFKKRSLFFQTFETLKEYDFIQLLIFIFVFTRDKKMLFLQNGVEDFYSKFLKF